MLQKKVCMIGSFAVGKTSLVRRFIESLFSEAYHTTIGVKVDKKVVQVKGQDVTLVLWDIYGEDVFQKLQMSYLRGMAGYLLVADGTRQQTFDDAIALGEKIGDSMGKIPFIFLLNKCDLSEQWDVEPDREEALQARGWTVLRSSAKTGESVEQAFSMLTAAMIATQ
jgi:small GTP-binding protein